MKKILFIFILLASAFFANAQQENHYTMFMYNKIMYNPGVAGAREVPSVMALYRNQWISYKGAPQSQLINFDTPLGKTRASIGAQVSHHKIGVQRNIFANLAYSYAIVRTKTTSLRMGLNGAFQNYMYDFNDPELYVRDGVSGDVTVSEANQQKISKGNFGTGIYFDHKNFYVGLSAPNLLQNGITSTAIQYRHFYAMAGAVLPLSSSIDLKPAASVRYVDNAPISFDANLMFIFAKKFHVGASYRIDSQAKSESTDFILYFQPMGQLGFGLAYDLTVSGLGKASRNTIEALVRYDLRNANGINGKFDNPRFFF